MIRLGAGSDGFAPWSRSPQSSTWVTLKVAAPIASRVPMPPPRVASSVELDHTSPGPGMAWVAMPVAKRLVGYQRRGAAQGVAVRHCLHSGELAVIAAENHAEQGLDAR